MSAHLSQDEISGLLIGAPQTRAVLHVQRCAICRGQVSEFESALAGLRNSIRSWSASEASGSLLPLFARTRVSRWPAGLVTVAALLISVVFLHSNSSMPRSEVSDVALLNQVEQQISQNAPAAMQPLAQMAFAERAAEKHSRRFSGHSGAAE